MRSTQRRTLLGFIILSLIFNSCFKDDLLKEIDALKTQVSTMQKRNDSLNNVLNVRADSLGKALSNAQKRSDSLANVLRTKSDSLSLALGITNANLANLTKSVDSIKTQIASISGQLTQLNLQLTSITSQLTQLNQQLGALGGDVSQLAAQYQALSTSLQTINTQIAALQAEQLKLLEKLNAILLQLNPPIDLTTGLFAYYPFSGNAGDSSGKGNHGVVNGTTLTTDRFNASNKAYYFSGSNSYIDIPNNFFDNGLTNSTISLWFNPASFNANTGGGLTFINTQPHNGMGLGFSYNGAQKIYFYKNSNPTVSSWDILSNSSFNYTPINLNTWYHVLLIKTGLTYSYYLNGQLLNSVNTTINPLSYLCSMRIGALSGIVISGQTFETFNGKLDDIRFYNRALTQSEITYLANN